MEVLKHYFIPVWVCISFWHLIDMVKIEYLLSNQQCCFSSPKTLFHVWASSEPASACVHVLTISLLQFSRFKFTGVHWKTNLTPPESSLLCIKACFWKLNNVQPKGKTPSHISKQRKIGKKRKKIKSLLIQLHGSWKATEVYRRMKNIAC